MTIGVAFPEVLAAACAGADWAWERLVTSIAASVRGYLAAHGATDPDDLTGEVLLQLVRGIHRFEGDETGFRSWVFLIAHHRLVDEHRRRSRDELKRASQEPSGDAPAADAAFEGASGIDWSERLGGLSEDQRHVILLRVVAGLPTEEVARILNKPLGTVRVLQHRALARLRQGLVAGVTQ